MLETVANWENEDLPLLNQGCWQRLKNTGVFYTNRQHIFLSITGYCGDGLGGYCPPNIETISGEYRIGYIDRTDFIITSHKNDDITFRHEVLHELGECVLGESDPEHEQSYWGIVAPL